MFIFFYLANNLYGHAMCQHLPISNYEWVKQEDCSDEEMQMFSNVNTILNTPNDAENGYIFEVDVTHPKSTHVTQNDFPFCAEKRTLPEEAVHINGLKKSKIKKLLLTLHDKKNYVIHYSMLKLALQHGVVVTKVHRILKFKQSPWLKPYIELNTELRKRATNDFEKTLYKLYNNAIFGVY